MDRRRNGVLVVLAALVFAAAAPQVPAQEIEPRAYSNAPIGVNFLIAGYVETRGGLSFDAAVPLTNEQLRTSNAVFAYARVLDFGGRSGKFDVIVPYTRLRGTADFRGDPVERDISGFNRPLFRLSINLYGAPALALGEFSDWQQDVIIGASLQIAPPWAQYDDSRILNIGSHRWSFKPEVGVSKALGPWTIEAQAAAVFFTDNHDFLDGSTRAQDPLFALQGHVIYAFRSGKWLSLDGTWFAGGRSSIDDVRRDDLQQNWRIGMTVAIPVDRRNSIKFSASSGVAARTGNNFDAVGLAWQYRWGAGLR